MAFCGRARRDTFNVQPTTPYSVSTDLDMCVGFVVLQVVVLDRMEPDLCRKAS